MITIDSKAFVASMQAARKHFAKLVLDAVKDAATKAAQFVKASGLFVNRTGRLKQSAQPSLLSNTHSRTTADAPHAAWVEYGNTFRTGAQFIFPNPRGRGRFLKFVVDGRFIRTTHVRASKPRPFMDEAATKTEPLFDQMCRTAVDRMFG